MGTTEGTFQDQIQWLVRKNTPIASGDASGSRTISGITVLGPFMTDQVREMLKSGMLEADDELCPENSYWFGLHELAEVKRYLGLDQIVIARNPDQETTQPDLEKTPLDFKPSPDDKTPPGIEAVIAQPNAEGFNPDATGMLSVKRAPAPEASAKATAAAAATAAATTAAAAVAAGGAPVKAGIPPKPVVKPPTAQELANRFQRVLPQAPLAYTNTAVEAERGNTVLGFERGRILAALIVAGIVVVLLGVIWFLRNLRTL